MEVVLISELDARPAMILHGYWRSSTSHRTRIALNLKGLTYETVVVNLPLGEQAQPAHRALQPQGLVPALEVEADGAVLIQSVAILEWLEERFPDPPLLPKDPLSRAIVRSMAAIIGCDIHPLNNLRVLGALRRDFAADQNAILAWTQRWITEGFAALEILLERYGSTFAFGDSPTLADCYLVPQVYSAERFHVDLGPFPRIAAAASAAGLLPAFIRAHPSVQAGADPAPPRDGPPP